MQHWNWVFSRNATLKWGAIRISWISSTFHCSTGTHRPCTWSPLQKLLANNGSFFLDPWHDLWGQCWDVVQQLPGRADISATPCPRILRGDPSPLVLGAHVCPSHASASSEVERGYSWVWIFLKVSGDSPPRPSTPLSCILFLPSWNHALCPLFSAPTHFLLLFQAWEQTSFLLHMPQAFPSCIWQGFIKSSSLHSLDMLVCLCMCPVCACTCV